MVLILKKFVLYLSIWFTSMIYQSGKPGHPLIATLYGADLLTSVEQMFDKNEDDPDCDTCEISNNVTFLYFGSSNDN